MRRPGAPWRSLAGSVWRPRDEGGLRRPERSCALMHVVDPRQHKRASGAVPGWRGPGGAGVGDAPPGAFTVMAVGNCLQTSVALERGG